METRSMPVGTQNMVSILEFLKLIGSHSRIKWTPEQIMALRLISKKPNDGRWNSQINLKDRLPVLINNIRTESLADTFVALSPNRQGDWGRGSGEGGPV